MRKRRDEPSIFVVTGTRQFSLGAALVDQLATQNPQSKILAIDAEPTPSPFSNVAVGHFDLNPFEHKDGFESWSAALNELLRSLGPNGGARCPVRCVFLGAAQYQVGRYESSTTGERASVLGCNIVGKWEVLHSVMQMNVDYGFSNTDELDVFDVGSFHSLRHTAHRALYNATKAAGLELCKVLLNGSEVRRAVHVSPGPIDTPMLHWNHWALNVYGDKSFPRLVRNRQPAFYRLIFREGDSAALEITLRDLGLDSEAIREVFARYLHRRAVLAESEEGITSPEALAEFLAGQISRTLTMNSGIIEVSSPQGRMRAVHRSF